MVRGRIAIAIAGCWLIATGADPIATANPADAGVGACQQLMAADADTDGPGLPAATGNYADPTAPTDRPAAEPRQQDGNAAGGGGYSDDEWNAHVDFVKQALADAPTTEELFTEPDGLWDMERLGQQNALMDEFWQREGADAVPREGRAIIAGGVSGAGKTTVLEGPAGIDRSQYFTINPDDVKKAMVARGMIPQISGLSPMEAATKAQEEASMLAKRLADRAYRNRTNAVWDITMSSEDSVRDRIAAMRTAGYLEIDAVFVDVPLDTARLRVTQRWRRGQEKYRAGRGFGGRYVPDSFIDASAPDQPGFSSRNEEVFASVADQFSSVVEFDNSGARPFQRCASGPRWEN